MATMKDIRIDDSGMLTCDQADQGGPWFALPAADACALRRMCQHVIHLLGGANHPTVYQLSPRCQQQVAPGWVISQSSCSS